MTHLLLAFLVLLLLALAGEFLRGARPIDRLALPLFVLLAVVTRPSPGLHEATIGAAIVADAGGTVLTSTAARSARAVTVAARLEHRDFGVVTVSTLHGAVVGVGGFGRVFVRPPPSR